MPISNKILVNFFLEEDHSQEDGEVYISWAPINFAIYSDLFVDILDVATSEWLSENKLDVNRRYEVIFQHVIDRDGAGAVCDEWFVPLHSSSETV